MVAGWEAFLIFAQAHTDDAAHAGGYVGGILGIMIIIERLVSRFSTNGHGGGKNHESMVVKKLDEQTYLLHQVNEKLGVLIDRTPRQ